MNPGFETALALSLVRTPFEACLEGVIPASERYESVSKVSARLESVITLEKTSNRVEVPGHLATSHKITLTFFLSVSFNYLFLVILYVIVFEGRRSRSKALKRVYEAL